MPRLSGSGLDDLVLVPGEDALHEVAVAVRGLRCDGEGHRHAAQEGREIS